MALVSMKLGFSLLVAFTACGRVGFEAPEIPLVSVGLQAEWSTPNSIRWQWQDPSTLDDPPAALELIVVPLRDGLKGATAVVFTADDNPELGFLDNDTITDGLEPGIEYVAQLSLLDRDGSVRARSKERATMITPAAASDAIVLFSDEPTDGYSIPSELAYSDAGAYRGTHCYRYESVCGANEAGCFENLRRQGTSFDLSVIGDARFEDAFVEFAVAADTSVHSEWSQVRFMMKNIDTGETRIFSADSFTIRADSEYRLYQVPLDHMFNSDQALSQAIATSDALYEFGVGGTWGAEAAVRLDEVLVRY